MSRKTMSIKDMLKKSLQQKKPTREEQELKKALEQSKEDQELKKALELSKQEHENEQKKRLEHYAHLSKQTLPTVRKRRFIEKDEDDPDDWFQTVSNRRPQKVNKRPHKVKEERNKVKEERNETLLDIDDVTTFLAKEEPEESYDLTDLLQEEEKEKEDEDISRNMISDSDSDCSIIDLVEQPFTIPTQEEDDGYLSPLEGFTSLKDVGEDPELDFYYQQLTPSTTKKRKTITTKTKTSSPKKFFSKKRFWANKKK